MSDQFIIDWDCPECGLHDSALVTAETRERTVSCRNCDAILKHEITETDVVTTFSGGYSTPISDLLIEVVDGRIQQITQH